MPDGSVEIDGVVYQRKPWRGRANVLVRIGKMQDGKYVPGVGSGLVNPLKASKKSNGK
jgi:hypothetical protein